MDTTRALRSGLAALEVCAVFAAGNVLGFLIAQRLGVTLRNPLLALVEDPTIPLAPLAGELAALLFWQYLGWGICAGLMYWLRPRDERAASLTVRPARSGREQMGDVMIVALLIALPSIVLSQAQELWQFGVRAPWFDALQRRDWDWQYWLFTAVGSFAVVPVVEELFYRGYVFRRVAGGWNPAAGVAMSATMFAWSHSQYVSPDPFNVAMLANIVWVGVVLACATWYTGGVGTAILAHAVINLPMTPAGAAIVIAVLAVGVTLLRTRWTPLRDFALAQWREARGASVMAGALSGVAFIVAFRAVGFTISAVAAPILALLVIRSVWLRVRP
jgi:membrane protease YdiL (CAAX protease family)